MKVSARLALAASVIVTVGIMIVEITQGVSDEEFVWGFAMIGIWALKFILGALIDKKAETKD